VGEEFEPIKDKTMKYMQSVQLERNIMKYNTKKWWLEALPIFAVLLTILMLGITYYTINIRFAEIGRSFAEAAAATQKTAETANEMFRQAWQIQHGGQLTPNTVFPTPPPSG
jgi:hypothetical protein